MHRVELKEHYERLCIKQVQEVPNAPCGVEKYVPNYRVELKSANTDFSEFLMHRVELKDDKQFRF
jgi:hypothetical protein